MTLSARSASTRSASSGRAKAASFTRRIAGASSGRSSRMVMVDHVGDFSRSDAIDFPDLAADFGGDALRFFFFVKIELDFEVNIGARHGPMIR